MSFIIRIMLEFEMQQENIAIEPVFVIPPLYFKGEEIESQIQRGNNYSSYSKVSHANLEVYSEFLCPAG